MGSVNASASFEGVQEMQVALLHPPFRRQLLRSEEERRHLVKLDPALKVANFSSDHERTQ